MKKKALGSSLAAFWLFLSLSWQVSADDPAPPMTASPGTTAESPTQPAFRVVVGQGYSVCEAYARNLNTLASSAAMELPPSCTLPIHPGFTAFQKPHWEDLDINDNLPLIHAAELLLKDWLVPRHHPSPVFAEWVVKYQRQVESGEFQPQLRRARLALNQKGVETLIWYRPDVRECERSNALLGFGPGGHIFVLRDGVQPPLETIQGSGGSNTETEILTYRGKTFFFMSGWTMRLGSPPPQIWWAGVSAVFPRTDPPVSAYLDRYVMQPRCEIEFRK